MIKEKLKRGSIFYKLYLYYQLFIKYKIFQRNRQSFSQFGEDKFIIEYFKNKTKGRYVDLGAFHPFRMNNTYLLYKKGWSGTNIDFNHISIDMFKLVRKRDQNICSVISDVNNEETKTYFLNDWSTANSAIFDEKAKIEKEIIMKSKNFENLIKHNFDFLNIDLEGDDYKVLRSIDFKKFNPKLICIEILQKDRNKEKIFNYMKENKFTFIKQCDVSFFFERQNEDN